MKSILVILITILAIKVSCQSFTFAELNNLGNQKHPDGALMLAEEKGLLYFDKFYLPSRSIINKATDRETYYFYYYTLRNEIGQILVSYHIFVDEEKDNNKSVNYYSILLDFIYGQIDKYYNLVNEITSNCTNPKENFWLSKTDVAFQISSKDIRGKMHHSIYVFG